MIIELQNGTKLDTALFGLKRLYHYIPSIKMSQETVSIDGGVGSRVIDSRFESRSITVRFFYEAYDIQDYYLLRDQVNALFTKREYFYIIFKNESYKRYKVRLQGNFLVTPNNRGEQFEVEFLCEDLYGEAVATTLTLKEWDADAWGWNGTIAWDDELIYSFDTPNFNVMNAGTAIVDPRSSYSRILVRGDFPTGVVIKNVTTGDTYSYNGKIIGGDILRLEGVQTFLNKTSMFSLTNKKLITFNPGYNQFEITGGTLHSIIFDFRFLYL